MRRSGIFSAAVAALVLFAPFVATAEPSPPQLDVGLASVSTTTEPSKIDVMALWAHPDDDASFTTPCGVWGDLFDIKCGIIMITRGEGGSNSVGNEAGPQLGLRRENEDRASHVRTGTLDIFNIDRVDFYYNTSAPLTQQVWDGDETLRRVVRVIRETRPSVMIGWPPNFDYGHGNHQYAGRLVWEAVSAAADPQRFPDQLTGVGAVKPWQVKKVIQQTGWGFKYKGEGGQAAPNCNVDYTPEPANPFTMVGTWSGYASPYTWVEGNTAEVAAGTPKTWAQVGREGGRAHPTQARRMQTDAVEPSCLRFAVLKSVVPMQPGGTAAGDSDQALFLGAAVPDPGGFPLETIFSLTPESFSVAPGEPFKVHVKLDLPEGKVPEGTITLRAPAGWEVSQPVAVGGQASATATFSVIPAIGATSGIKRLSATFDGGGKKAWNTALVQAVPTVEGLFERTGNSAELDAWNDKHDVHLCGRSPAINQIGAGESKTVSVEVMNRSSTAQSGTVAVTMPDGFTVDSAVKPFEALAAGASAKVKFIVTHTTPAAIGGEVAEITATTTAGGSTASEKLQLYVVPTTVIPKLTAAPTIDGVADSGYSTDPIQVGKKWEGVDCNPDGSDCGQGSVARLGWYDDALYAHIKVIDDRASAAVTPDRCFGHWLVDSVELLADPRGNSADTSTTFKLGVFPFTDDPNNTNGNGVDGPCWSRDTDNHQGFSTGPLAERIQQAPNAPGVQVAVKADRSADGGFVGGAYEVEVKVPLADLPSAVGPTSKVPTGDASTNKTDPSYMGFNLTPYDSDNANFIGETRTAWSAFGSQQSEPYRWGHAYLADYNAPVDRPTRAKAPVIPDTALQGVESPQTIHQSAMRGVTISGVQPSESLKVTGVRVSEREIVISYDATRAGKLRGFVWKGDPRFVPVWTSSCKGQTDGFDACSPDDGKAPAWAPDMGGRLKAEGSVSVKAGKGELSVPLAKGVHEDIAKDSKLLLAFAERRENGDGVNAWSYPIVPAGAEPTGTPTATVQPTKSTPEPSVTAKPVPTVTSLPKPGLPNTGR